MNAVDIILIIVIVLILAFALHKCIQDHKKGKTCDGNCAQCGQNCTKH